MLLKINDQVSINASAIVGLIPSTNIIPAEYSGMWFWKKQVSSEIIQYKIKLTYICAIDNHKTWLEWTFDSDSERDRLGKYLTDIIMKFDDEYIDRAFEREVLK